MGDFPEINPGSERGTPLFNCVCGVNGAYLVENFKLIIVLKCLILRLRGGKNCINYKVDL